MKVGCACAAIATVAYDLALRHGGSAGNDRILQVEVERLTIILVGYIDIAGIGYPYDPSRGCSHRSSSWESEVIRVLVVPCVQWGRPITRDLICFAGGP